MPFTMSMVAKYKLCTPALMLPAQLPDLGGADEQCDAHGVCCGKSDNCARWLVLPHDMDVTALNM